MKQIYGASFVTIYGDNPGALWIEQIAGLTDAQCRHGLSQLASQRREYPANLTEFVDASRPKVKPPYHAPYLPRPTPQRASREHIDNCLANIRAHLGRSRQSTKKAAAHD